MVFLDEPRGSFGNISIWKSSTRWGAATTPTREIYLNCSVSRRVERGGLVTRDFYTTVGEKNHVSIFFFGFAPKFSRLDSSLLKTRNLLGVFVRNNIFLRGLGPTSVFYMFSVDGGRGIRRGREMYTKRFCAAKRAYPLQNADFLRIKKTKKNTITISTSITDQASHASRQAHAPTQLRLQHRPTTDNSRSDTDTGTG